MVQHNIDETAVARRCHLGGLAFKIRIPVFEPGRAGCGKRSSMTTTTNKQSLAKGTSPQKP